MPEPGHIPIYSNSGDLSPLIFSGAVGSLAAFGTETYSKEELIAEIGSASLMNMLDIETRKSFRNSAAYIQNWLQVLKNDNKFIVSAAGKAEKAVNYIIGQ